MDRRRVREQVPVAILGDHIGCRPGQYDGTFSLPLLPGDYVVRALPQSTLDSWQAARRRVEKYAADGVAMTVAEADNSAVALRFGRRIRAERPRVRFSTTRRRSLALRCQTVTRTPGLMVLMSPSSAVLGRKAIAKPFGLWSLPTAIASPACHSVTVPVALRGLSRLGSDRSTNIALLSATTERTMSATPNAMIDAVASVLALPLKDATETAV